MTEVTVGTWNAPPRLGAHDSGFRWMVSHGADVIVMQEQTDRNDWRSYTPAFQSRWGRWRPGRARSVTLYWNRSTVRRGRKRGALRMSSPDFGSLRYLVWSHFRVREGNRPVRVGGIHLPAFKTSRPRHAREFRRQESKAARWLDRGPNRVLAGDFNATLPSRFWCQNLSRVGRWSKRVRSGPHGTRIDYVGAPKDGRWQVVKTQRGPKFSSDHHIVLVTLKWVG